MFGTLLPRRERTLVPSQRIGRMMTRFEDEMEDLLGRWFGEDGGRLPTLRFVPSIDLVESESSYLVTVDLPGLKPEEVEVELKNGELWISGKREEGKEEEGKTYHRVERQHGEFRRVIRLAEPINEEKVEAKFVNGVLQVTVPNSEEAKAKHIPVTT